MTWSPGELDALGAMVGAPLAGWVAVALARRGRVRQIAHPARWVVVAIVLSFLGYSAIALAKLDAYNMGAEDLGRIDQAIWSVTQGQLLVFSESVLDRPMSRLAGHVELLYVPLAALFWLWDSAAVLLLAQAAMVAAGGWPAYRLGQRIGGDGLGLAAAIAYLLHPAVGYATLSDIHGDTLAMPLLMLALERGYAGRSVASFLATVAAVCGKQYVAALAVAMGLYWFIGHRRRRLGSACVVLGIVWVTVVVPGFHRRYRPPDFPASTPVYFEKLGSTPAEVVKTALTQPHVVVGEIVTGRKLGTLALLLAPLALLPVAAPEILALTAPVLIPLAVTPSLDLRNHHNATLIPFLILAAAIGGRRVAGSKAPLAMLCATVVAHALVAPSPLAVRSWTPGRWDYLGNPHIAGRTPHDRVLDRAIESIPAGARVTASGHLVPHLSHRPVCFTFPSPSDDAAIDYAVVDVLGSWPPPYRPRRAELDRLGELLDHGFDIEMSQYGVLVLSRRPRSRPPVEESPAPVCAEQRIGPVTLRRHVDGSLSWRADPSPPHPWLLLDRDTGKVHWRGSSPQLAPGSTRVGPDAYPSGRLLEVRYLLEGFPATDASEPPQPWLPLAPSATRRLPLDFDCTHRGPGA